ncbi:hypothetical protein CHS0354_013776 [Potamilus streckersoni]|uniref:RING-type domain-containing protein n=1 Tax=Potamilus streckersoni TaxID=2493646 RepID=A0AAE0SGN7_9BIVA|nr:hypothetical protein CHS0354_013776 [Potamilus streckersoni]
MEGETNFHKRRSSNMSGSSESGSMENESNHISSIDQKKSRMDFDLVQTEKSSQEKEHSVSVDLSGDTQEYSLSTELDVLNQNTQPNDDDQNVDNAEKINDRDRGKLDDGMISNLNSNSMVHESLHSTGKELGNEEVESYVNSVGSSLTKIESVQRDAEMILCIIPNANVNHIYDKIKKRRKDNNRIDIVTNEILEELPKGKEDNDKTEKIVEDVRKVMEICPNADPNEVYTLLEQEMESSDRVKTVSNKIQKSGRSVPETADAKSDSSIGSDPLLSNPEFKKNPLYRDVRTIHKALPCRDTREIYAYLEAHFDKLDRVKIVLEELTKSDGDSQETIPEEHIPSFDSQTKYESKGKQPLTLEDRLVQDVKELCEILTDCDPDYLYQRLEESLNDGDRVKKIAAELLEKGNYPKLKERIEKEKKQAFKRELENLEFDMGKFLNNFPSPSEFFYNTEKAVSKNYQDHVLVFLKNTYPMLKDGYIRSLMKTHANHLAPVVQELERELPGIAYGGRSKKLRMTNRQGEYPYPDNPDEFFFQEVQYCQHKQEIANYLEEEKRQREQRVMEAKEKDELFECSCCFDDECLFEDMMSCADGHLFCKECVRRSTETAIGVGKTEFLCLTGSCEHHFTISVLQQVLPPNMFSILLRKLQEEEIKAADIPDLVSCPFCSFATIMPNKEDKVFHCQNAECLKESCRLCKEPNHIPLRCDEIEKQGETSMRAYIEERMTEAMLRTCPKCKKNFYKESGCNKMTCVCGTTMCYVCRKANIDYDHFKRGVCPPDSNSFKLHKEEMLRASEAARKKYIEEHPDAIDINLKFDPLKHLEGMRDAYAERYGGDDDENVSSSDGLEDDQDMEYY